MRQRVVRRNPNWPGPIRSAILPLVLAFVAVPVLLGAQRGMSGLDISDAVEDELLFDRTVPLDRVDVTTSNGIVTLSGTVSNLLAKERAARIAGTVKGVRSVVNQVEVRPVDAGTDGKIRSEVVTALTLDPATDSFEVDVDVQNGRVSLSGTVDSWSEKELAETVAKSVKGVRAIDNELEVAGNVERTAEEIEAEVGKSIRWDVLVDDGLIDVSVENDTVILSGVVGSALEKTRAITDVWVAGVRTVDATGLEVARWARDDELRQDKYVSRTDEEIRNAIEDALARDPRVYSFDIDTRVTGGVVTLRGVVDNLGAKRAAAQDARNTVGVLDVSNRIKVRPESLATDAEIEARTEAALLRDAIVESYEIEAQVTDGRVTLSGQVDSFFEKFHAYDVVSRVPGVISIHNEIEVDEAATIVYDPYLDPNYSPFGEEFGYGTAEPRFTILSDDEIEEEVNDQLWWSPFVDADDIFVSVENGVVTLIGTVESWAEATAAIENAYEGGAVDVDNELVVGSS